MVPVASSMSRNILEVALRLEKRQSFIDVVEDGQPSLSYPLHCQSLQRSLILLALHAHLS